MVTGAYYPEISSGGVQCQNMARELSGQARVSVLTTAVDPTLTPEDEVEGVPVTRIIVDVRSGLSKARAALRMAWRALALMRDTDLVHLHGCSSKNVLVTFVAKVLRKPVVLSLHTAGYDEPEAVERDGSLALWAFLSADRYLTVSRSLFEACRAYGLPPAKVTWVPNGIDLQRFAPPADRSAARRQLDLRGDRPMLIFVGFFSADKQPRVLFDAWLRLHARGVDCDLMFVGETETGYFEIDARLAVTMKEEAAARALAERLIFVGATHAVAEHLQASDIFVLPSRREGLPVALLEAMACGLPCVASRLAGSTDTIITDGHDGVLVPPGDATAFAEAIAGLLADPARASRLGSAARSTIASRFSSDTVAELWMSVYQRIIVG